MSRRKPSLDSRDLLSREFELEVCLKTLKIYQRIDGEVCYAGWDASTVLAKYLEMLCERQADFFVEKKVLEVGSRLGLCGLVAATLGAQATLTETPDTLSIIRMNITENKAQIVCLGGYAIAEPLVWGDASSDLLRKAQFDYVFLADCICFEEYLDPLIITLTNVNASSSIKATIFISQEITESANLNDLWEKFLSKMRKYFVISKIADDEQHPSYRSKRICLLKAVRQ